MLLTKVNINDAALPDQETSMTEKPPRNILIVEDHDVLRRELQSWLTIQFSEYEVCASANAEEALDIIKDADPSLVLIDISLPGMNGIDATRIIKNTCRDTQVIVITQLNGIDYIGSAYESGADVFILKQHLSRDLISTIEKLLLGEKCPDPPSKFIHSSTPGNKQRD
jgi:DNA-binding NarL/FixJ family response regulator